MPASTATGAPPAELPSEIAPEPHVGRWLFGAAVLGATAWTAVSLWHSPALDRATIGRYLTADAILEGLGNTLVLAVTAMVIGSALSVVVALCRLSDNPVSRAIGWAYVWVFRGVPLLVQILIWGNLALFIPRIGLGNPVTGDVLVSWETNSVITGFVASLLALALNEAGYMAEIVRAGVLSVPHGQTEAARALGMSRAQAFRKVVLPQALRMIVPPSGTQFVNMLKMTSLVSVIAGGDLLTQAQNISASNLRTIELLVVASAWYLLITSVSSAGQALLERRLARGQRR
ncbi:amino acid ABC transporter permease [Pseudonocardia acaciae]|uniref:amino acid ABC transporter permease n=1 Tax=Pseudonocardia acaciae TaxID=551276 RepID=UPI000688B647|nr:amino acid ABC transporter permease [Pseudonocardia acaciae]